MWNPLLYKRHSAKEALKASGKQVHDPGNAPLNLMPLLPFLLYSLLDMFVPTEQLILVLTGISLIFFKRFHGFEISLPQMQFSQKQDTLNKESMLSRRCRKCYYSKDIKAEIQKAQNWGSMQCVVFGDYSLYYLSMFLQRQLCMKRTIYHTIHLYIYNVYSGTSVYKYFCSSITRVANKTVRRNFLWFVNSALVDKNETWPIPKDSQSSERQKMHFGWMIKVWRKCQGWINLYYGPLQFFSLCGLLPLTC